MKVKSESKGDFHSISYKSTAIEVLKNYLTMVIISSIFIGPIILFLIDIVKFSILLYIVIGILFIEYLYTKMSLGGMVIEQRGNTILLVKKRLFRKKYQYEFSDRDLIVLKRVKFLKYTGNIGRNFNSFAERSRNNRSFAERTRGNRSIAQKNRDNRSITRAAELNRLLAERRAISHHIVDYDGYKASVQKLELDAGEQQQIDVIDSKMNRWKVGYRVSSGWGVYYQSSDKDPVLLQISNGHDAVKLNKFVELVSQILKIRMVDHTGLFPLVLNHDETDARIVPDDMLPMDNSPSKFIIEDHVISYQFRELSDNSIVTLVAASILFGFPTILILAFFRTYYNGGEVSAWPLLVVLVLLLYFIFFYIFRYITRRVSIEFLNDADEIMIEDKFLFWKKRETIVKSDIERVIIIEMFPIYALELISDHKRISTPFIFSFNEVRELNHFVQNQL